MPYVYVEELGEGQEEADVRTADEYNTLQAGFEALTAERDAIAAERDELQGNYDTLSNEHETLTAELADAKTKFANAFLSSQQKQQEETEEKPLPKPQSFSTLFGRKK